MLEKYLKDVGLNEKEASIYLSLLEGDGFSVLELAKKTKINRTTIYNILKTLLEKGLISETTTDKKTHYQAEPPERLRSYVERRMISLEEMSKKLDDVIPQLKSVQRESGARPIVKYFEGKEGILSVNAEQLKAGDNSEKMYMIYSKDLVEEVFKPEAAKLRATRISSKIKGQSVYTYTKGELPADEFSERVRIDDKKYSILCDILIYQDKVRISTLRKNLAGIYIQSQDLAETLKSLVRLIHDLTKKNEPGR